MSKREENYIDYIVDELVEDTILEWKPTMSDRSPITIPWMKSKWRITFKFFLDILSHPFVWEEGFSDYIEDMYGVPDDLKLYIWLNYKEEMYQKYSKIIKNE
jgi:hypothetical protein